MYTKYYTKSQGSKISKVPHNYSIFPVKSNRIISNPKKVIKTTPRMPSTASSKQKPQIIVPQNDLMFNIAMSNMVKFQDAIVKKPMMPNSLSLLNIEDKKNDEANLNDSNELIRQYYQPEPFPEKIHNNNNINETSNAYNKNKFNDRKLLYTLKTLDLENLFIAFNLNSITFNDLFLLSKEDLLELRIPLGPRNRLLHFAEEYKKTAKDYDYKELTDFFQRNKCFLINHVQDFSCNYDAEGYSKNNNQNSILLSPKGNSRQPNMDIVNLSSFNQMNVNNLKDEADNSSIKSNTHYNKKSNSVIGNNSSYKNLQYNRDTENKNVNVSLLRGLSNANSSNQIYEDNEIVEKKNNKMKNLFHNANSSNNIDEIKKTAQNVNKSNHGFKSVCPPQPSLNQSIISFTNNPISNNNYNNNLNLIVPLTIANIEEPIPIKGCNNELMENNQNDSQSIAYSEIKQSSLNKSDFTTNSTSMHDINPKNTKSQLIQNFQNIFIEVEQFQHQYESMKQKNDQRKKHMNTLMTKKTDADLKAKGKMSQPRNYQISLGKEDLYNESERNLNDELSKLYDSEIKTSSNTSIQQHRYYKTNSNKDNNSRYFYETDFQTQK